MMMNKTNVLRGLSVIGYGVFIATALIQSFEAYADSAVLTTVGKFGLAVGSGMLLIYLFMRKKENHKTR